jgi:uncharacterized protein
MKPVVLVFAKLPESGRVKTRLAKDVGAEAALEIYRELAERTWAQVVAADAERWLVFDPPDREAEVEAWLPGADRYLSQASGDLGVRLSAAFDAAFDAGAPAAAVIGTDIPGLTAELLDRALDTLAPDEASFGPATDGGYWLLALARRQPSLFTDMPWSTERVGAITLDRIRALGLSIRTLPTLDDVDTAEDLARWRC